MNTNRISSTSRFFALFALLFLITTAQAQEYSWGTSRPYSSSPVRIDVIDDTGRVLNKISANSKAYKTRRSYLEATKGKRYKLRIRNTSNRRIGVVVAVDGRNILTGQKSYLRNNEKMYILDAYETANYKGWRTNKNHVNRFYFTTAGDSYSNAWGDRSAMGVIAVAVFNEKRHYLRKKYQNDFKSRSAPSARGNFADESTGTGFGREEYSPTINVRFKANYKPAYKHFLKYEWRSTLCKRGIINCYQYEQPSPPNRFWPREANNNYAPYPPGYHQNSWKRAW